MNAFVSNELEPFAYLIYMIAVFFQYNRYKLLRHKVLFFYHALAAILLYAGLVLTKDNNWSYNVLFFATICVFSWYFHAILDSNRIRLLVIICFLLNSMLYAYVGIVKGNFLVFNNYVYGINFITIVLYVLFYFYQLLKDVKEENLLMNFDFWFISGCMLYFLGSFVIVTFYQENVLFRERGKLWSIHNVILFICSVITAIACFKIAKKQKQQNG